MPKAAPDYPGLLHAARNIASGERFPEPRPRSRSRTVNGVRVTRHLHKIGGGWTVHVKGERRAWFVNSKDLERWMRATLTLETSDYLIDRLGEMDA